jgi:uridine kinase
MSAVGKLPWFDINGKPVAPYIIGITGGSASGKTSVSQRIISQLGIPWVLLLSMDSFYKSLTKEQIDAAHRSEYNFDHPDAFDVDKMIETLLNLRAGVKVDVPVYDFATHSRLDVTTPMYGANVIVFEGLFTLYDKRVRDLLDLKIFVDTDADVRLARRLRRDIAERGRSAMGVLAQYSKFVKPAFDDFIHPTKKYADVVVPRGLDNSAAINVIIKHIQRQLDERGIDLRTELGQSNPNITPNVCILKQTGQLRHIHTMVRDKNCAGEEFCFYAKRLSQLLIESAISMLPYEAVQVETPTNSRYRGCKLDAKVCAVSVLAGGLALEEVLKEEIPEVSIAKVLIQPTGPYRNPVLEYCRFPAAINHGWAIILNDQILTGATAIMAIRIALDHHVPESKIIFVAMIASSRGLNNITKAFPNVKLVVSSIEDYELSDDKFIRNGFGDFAGILD